MLNDFIAAKLVSAHYQDLLHEANSERLLKEARAGQSHPLARLRLGLGDLLISSGLWMKGYDEQLRQRVARYEQWATEYLAGKTSR